jgi:hypothetical protein
MFKFNRERRTILYFECSQLTRASAIAVRGSSAGAPAFAPADRPESGQATHVAKISCDLIQAFCKEKQTNKQRLQSFHLDQLTV